MVHLGPWALLPPQGPPLISAQGRGVILFLTTALQLPTRLGPRPSQLTTEARWHCRGAVGPAPTPGPGSDRHPPRSSFCSQVLCSRSGLHPCLTSHPRPASWGDRQAPKGLPAAWHRRLQLGWHRNQPLRWRPGLEAGGTLPTCLLSLRVLLPTSTTRCISKGAGQCQGREPCGFSSWWAALLPGPHPSVAH